MALVIETQQKKNAKNSATGDSPLFWMVVLKNHYYDKKACLNVSNGKVKWEKILKNSFQSFFWTMTT